MIHHIGTGEATRTLAEYLQRRMPFLNGEVRQALEQAWCRKLELKRGERIDEDRLPEPCLFFIEEGCLKAARETWEQEMVYAFGWTGHCLFNLPRYLNPGERETYLEALKNCRVWAIRKSDFEAIMETSPELKQFWDRNLQGILLEHLEREALFMHSGPAARIDWLRLNQPEIFDEIPGVHIAAYLGIRPETLSRYLNLN